MSKSHPINPSVNRLARPSRTLVLGAAVMTIATISQTSSAQAPTNSANTPKSAADSVYAATHAPNPCVNDAERHRFDFWIGEWDVTTKSGSPVGSSTIESVSGSCGLLESWTSLRGEHGKSLNSYNPLLHQWQQYWVGQGGAVSEYRSSKFDGARLSFFIKDADPLKIQRLTFTPLDGATVRQHSEASYDGGKTWSTLYDFYYHRKRK